MKKHTGVLFITTLFMMVASTAFASEGGGDDVSLHSMAYLAAAIAIGVAAFGGSIGQGLGLGKAVEGIARNPGASGKIQTVLIIGLAMIESLAIYALVVSLIILFVKW